MACPPWRASYLHAYLRGPTRAPPEALPPRGWVAATTTSSRVLPAAPLVRAPAPGGWTAAHVEPSPSSCAPPPYPPPWPPLGAADVRARFGAARPTQRLPSLPADAMHSSRCGWVAMEWTSRESPSPRMGESRQLLCCQPSMLRQASSVRPVAQRSRACLRSRSPAVGHRR